jgi:hypothetical protein
MGLCLSSDSSPVASPTKTIASDISTHERPTITVDVTVMNPVSSYEHTSAFQPPIQPLSQHLSQPSDTIEIASNNNLSKFDACAAINSTIDITTNNNYINNNNVHENQDDNESNSNNDENDDDHNDIGSFDIFHHEKTRASYLSKTAWWAEEVNRGYR